MITAITVSKDEKYIQCEYFQTSRFKDWWRWFYLTIIRYNPNKYSIETFHFDSLESFQKKAQNIAPSQQWIKM